jgi:hypothetical protein
VVQRSRVTTPTVDARHVEEISQPPIRQLHEQIGEELSAGFADPRVAERPVYDWLMWPTHAFAFRQIGIVDHSSKFTLPVLMRLARFACPNVRPTSYIIMNGGSHRRRPSRLQAGTGALVLRLVTRMLQEDCEEL